MTFVFGLLAVFLGLVRPKRERFEYRPDWWERD